MRTGLEADAQDASVKKNISMVNSATSAQSVAAQRTSREGSPSATPPRDRPLLRALPALVALAPASPAPAASGHEFEALARPFLRAAYAGAFAVVKRGADAEDVAQDALLTAFEKIETCRDPARFRAWLLQIVRNRALNWLESRRLRDVPATDEEPAAELVFPVLPDAGLRDRLRRAMARLGAIPRKVVLLHDTEGWTHQEIADQLGISVLMSRKHLFQARRILREQLSSDRSGNATEALPVSPPRISGSASRARASQTSIASADSDTPARRRAQPAATELVF
jgi:RNA polymerase sigma-70 factor (ECF subfamily)